MALQLNNGVTNEYARFDGAGTGIAGDSWGFCCWLMRDTDTGTNDHPVGAYMDFSGGSPGFGIKVVNGTPDNYAQWKYGDSEITLREANLATWIFVAYRASGIFDGTAYHGTTTTLTGVAGNVGASYTLDSIHLGSYPSGSNPFKGRVAHLRFWSGAAPSQADFEAEMVSATAVRTANLFAAYEFANNSGTYLNDSSGNARHLTGTNIDFAANYIAGPTLGGGASAAISPSILRPNQSTVFGSAAQRFT